MIYVQVDLHLHWVQMSLGTDSHIAAQNIEPQNEIM